MTPKPHERLKAAIEERRSELGLTLREVADLTGITTETLRAIRNGKNEPSTLTKRGIERALQWSAGSVDRVLGGGVPGRVISGRVSGQLPAIGGKVYGEAGNSSEKEDPFEALDRAYAEWRQDPDVAEAEALRTFLEAMRDRKTG